MLNHHHQPRRRDDDKQSYLELEKLAKRAGELTDGQYHCDPQWLEKFAELVAARERDQCVEAVEAEKVNEVETGADTDKAYNQAIDDAVDAINRKGTRSDEAQQRPAQ